MQGTSIRAVVRSETRRLLQDRLQGVLWLAALAMRALVNATWRVTVLVSVPAAGLICVVLGAVSVATTGIDRLPPNLVATALSAFAASIYIAYTLDRQRFERTRAKLGCQTHAVADGREAVDAVGRGSYDVILMDLRMPRMDGFEATAEIRRRETELGVHVPIVAVTAHAMAGDEERCRAAGMDDYLAKPVRMEDLAEHLARWRPEIPSTPERHPMASAGSAVDLEQLDETCDGDPEMERELTTLFIDDSTDALAALDASIDAGDAVRLLARAHSLKGSCRYLGANALAETCADIESHGREGRLDDVRDALARARQELERVRDVIEARRQAAVRPGR